jgi:hypothetical protein
MRTLNFSVVMHLKNCGVTAGELADHVKISHGSIIERIHHRLGIHEVCSRCVPRKLIEEHKCKSLDIYQCLLSRKMKLMPFGDETWIQYCDPESKCQSIEWIHLDCW